MLSNYCRKTAGKYNIKVGVLKKLVPNSGNKTNYIVYYINLQLYLPLRIKLIKFHKVLKFKQLIGWKQYLSKPTFISQKTFSENFAAVHRIKPVLVSNKSIYIGFTVL